MRGIERMFQVFRAPDSGAASIAIASTQIDAHPSLDAILEAFEANEKTNSELPQGSADVNGGSSTLKELRRACFVKGVTKLTYSDGREQLVLDPFYPETAPEELRMREQMLQEERTAKKA